MFESNQALVILLGGVSITVALLDKNSIHAQTSGNTGETNQACLSETTKIQGEVRRFSGTVSEISSDPTSSICAENWHFRLDTEQGSKMVYLSPQAYLGQDLQDLLKPGTTVTVQGIQTNQTGEIIAATDLILPSGPVLSFRTDHGLALWNISGGIARADRSEVVQQESTNETLGAAGTRSPESSMQHQANDTRAFGIFIIPEDKLTQGVEAIDEIITESDEIREYPDRYIGNTVILRGEVVDIFTDNAYRVDYDGLIGSSEILVVGPAKNMPQAPQIGARVQIKGVVRPFGETSLAQMELQIEGYTAETPVIEVLQVY